VNFVYPNGKEAAMADMQDEIQKLFPPQGRHGFLDADAVRRLVETLQPGLKCQGNVERTYNGTWRLRVTANLVDGKRSRRGITLPDDGTAAWVREYIALAQLKRRQEYAEKAVNDVVHQYR
jgi:hypothetical protein